MASAAALALWPRTAMLRIDTTPPGAAVRIDGDLTVAITPAELPVDLGEHLVEITLEGHDTHVAQIDVREDTRIGVVLQPSVASLEISSEPPGALVMQDGLVLGTTPLTLGGLRVGSELRLELQAPGYHPLVHVHRSAAPGPSRLELRLVPVGDAAPLPGGSP
jgi:hypothetical protein